MGFQGAQPTKYPLPMLWMRSKEAAGAAVRGGTSEARRKVRGTAGRARSNARGPLHPPFTAASEQNFARRLTTTSNPAENMIGTGNEQSDMLRALSFGVSFFLIGTAGSFAQPQRITCQTQGPPIYLDQNNRSDYESAMDSNGCRYNFYSIGNNSKVSIVFEKAVIMKQPANGELRQEGEFSFFYKPKAGFKGRDNFVVYICGSDHGHSGCTRLNYNAIIR